MIADFLGSLITSIIRLYKYARYYQVRHEMWICLHSIYLHPLTSYSVRRQDCHCFVTTSLYYVVQEY